MSLGLITTLALGGGLLLLALALMQERMAFHPSPVVAASPASLGLEFRGLRLEADDGAAFSGWWVPSGPGAPALLFLHGNAGNISHRLHHIRHLHAAGLAVLIIDYRGYGRSPGRPTEKGLFLDARAAWKELTGPLGQPPGSVILYGESIGSVPALRLARELGAGAGSPAGLILEGAFTSALDMGRRAFPFLPVSWILRLEMNNLAAVRQVNQPILFIHGAEDEIVPKGMGRRLFQAAPHPENEFLEVPGASHNTVWLSDPGKLAERIASFADKTVRGR